MSLYDALEELYQRYGYYREDLLSITLKGKEGLDKIKGALQSLRQQPPEAIAQKKVTVREDYQSQLRTNVLEKSDEEIDLPVSDVLKYYLEDGSWFCVRPSGTEPKLKIYIGVKADHEAEANDKLSTMRKEIEAMISNQL
jgi:phosphoglucomutase